MVPRKGDVKLVAFVFSKEGVVVDPVFKRDGLVIKGSIDGENNA